MYCIVATFLFSLYFSFLLLLQTPLITTVNKNTDVAEKQISHHTLQLMDTFINIIIYVKNFQPLKKINVLFGKTTTYSRWVLCRRHKTIFTKKGSFLRILKFQLKLDNTVMIEILNTKKICLRNEFVPQSIEHTTYSTLFSLFNWWAENSYSISSNHLNRENNTASYRKKNTRTSATI